MAFQGDSIYWVEVEKIVPNPFQPRREFDEEKLRDLGDSIRMYGVLQPLTVTRKEIQREDGTFYSEYELIAGERRLRASKLAGVSQVPVLIRDGEDSEQEKLELAIIENLQREDLNAIDRALAFQQLADQFELNHTQVGKKVGRSREYVANSIRLLQLPEHMRDSVRRGELGEGHARTLLMLTDKPEEQETLFRETLLKKLSVRELERISRKIAVDRVRKQHKDDIDPGLLEIEKEFTETLGTRVQIMKTEFGGRLTIDYFSEGDLETLLQKIKDEHIGFAATTGTLTTASIDSTNESEKTSGENSIKTTDATTSPQTMPSTQTSAEAPPATSPLPPAPGTTSTTVSAEPTTSLNPAPASQSDIVNRLAAATPLTPDMTAPQTPQPATTAPRPFTTPQSSETTTTPTNPTQPSQRTSPTPTTPTWPRPAAVSAADSLVPTTPTHTSATQSMPTPSANPVFPAATSGTFTTANNSATITPEPSAITKSAADSANESDSDRDLYSLKNFTV